MVAEYTSVLPSDDRRKRRANFRRAAGWLAIALLMPGLAPGAQPAANPDWFATPYPYVLVEQDVRTAMNDFGQNLGLTVVFSDKVRGKSKGVVRGTDAGVFLQNLCDANALTWYFDGNVLYLGSIEDISTALFKPQDAQLDELRRYLASLDVFGQRLGMRDNPGSDELLVSGPPAYLALVRQHVALQRRPGPVASGGRSHGMRIFRGNSVSEVSPP